MKKGSGGGLLVLLLLIVAAVAVAWVCGLITIHNGSIGINTLSFVRNLNHPVSVP